MKKYRCLLNGQNFLLVQHGKEGKFGFYQKLIVPAETPEQAKRLAVARVWHDAGFKKIILNAKKDPPVIHLETIWEIDLVNDPEQQEKDRLFYPEPPWWQVVRRQAEKNKCKALFNEKQDQTDGK